MKIILKFFLLVACLSCKAQVIVPIASDSDAAYGNNTYNKDVDNDFAKYIGTWKYQNGNTSLTISFAKKTFEYFEYKNYYQDLLIGEYKYISNGTEIINTLSLLADNSLSGDDHNISGNLIWKKNTYPVCNDCTQNERRIKLSFYDPDRRYLSSSIILRYKNDNGTEKIIVKIYKSDNSIMQPDGSPDEMRLPYGEYILTKQP
ncbi:hypothetical protein MUB18_06730 [Sphingobacterium sp. PCS056]|uniref:DUF6705 domain-containing protein n=1 Tax=Flavobacterium cerinum TaxID=2502784 RepID=A0ABY5ISD7_9FLAO|nr:MULTISPECIES: DUF6705 family protein [Bacteroidota]UPZ37992.1 hypothetical protein MUB18_06730 [Sphingobacterium sp. PCS056]UUC45766.1 hypothetical protein NOX80_00805 [Flavobacterium cerinum]